MKAMALARLCAGTRSAAIVDPIEKKIPWEKAVMNRATSSSPKLVDRAATEFPTMKSSIRDMSRLFLLILLVRAVRTGAPMATPKAYPEMSRPARVMEIDRSSAIDDSNPTGTNSVVPIPNALIARASSAGVPPFDLEAF